MFQSPEFGESPDGGIFDLRVPGQSLKKRNCHNSKCSDHIDMKLGPEEEKQKKTKKIDDDVVSESCDVIAIFPIYDGFEAIRKRDSWRIVSKTYTFINSNLLFYKN